MSNNASLFHPLSRAINSFDRDVANINRSSLSKTYLFPKLYKCIQREDVNLYVESLKEEIDKASSILFELNSKFKEKNEPLQR